MRVMDLFTYLLLAGALVLAFLCINGCAASAPPRPPSWQDRVDVTAAVYLTYREGNAVSRCSAVAIGAHELLTAAHCIPLDPFIMRAIPSPGDRVLNVIAVQKDDLTDLAYLTLDGAPLLVQALPAERLPNEGEIVFAAGFGCYDTLAVYPGLYLGPAPEEVHGPDRLGFAMGICKGDSGGPVFDYDGKLIGILSARGNHSPVAIAAGVP